jgi:hypothetical protein
MNRAGLECERYRLKPAEMGRPGPDHPSPFE